MTVVLKNGEFFTVSGELQQLQAFYMEIIDGAHPFVELAEVFGARFAVRSEDVSSLLLDAAAQSQPLIASAFSRFALQQSAAALNQADLVSRSKGPKRE